VFATFESGTDYCGSHGQQTMLNFRVRDLDTMLARLRAKRAGVAKDVQNMEGVGRFGLVPTLCDLRAVRVQVAVDLDRVRRHDGDWSDTDLEQALADTGLVDLVGRAAYTRTQGMARMWRDGQAGPVMPCHNPATKPLLCAV
jgi:hypothetical protein